MIATLHHSLLAIALITLLELTVIVRILLRPHRDPASRIAWVVVVGRAASVGHARLSASGRSEHRPSSREAVARSPQAHAADPVSRPLGTRRNLQPPFPSVTGIFFGSATRSAGSIQWVATPHAFCRTPTPRSTRWWPTSIPQRITSMCCSTSGCRTTTALRSSRP